MLLYLNLALLVLFVAINYILNFYFPFWISLFKLAFFYGFYLGIVWAFDYIYMPILTIKFGYSMIFLLYPSLFLISLLGLWFYNIMAKSLNFDDVFFIGEISEWMKKREDGFWAKVRNTIIQSEKLIFISVSIWWSPFHAYLYKKYIQKRIKDEPLEIIKDIAHGSFYCTLFWGSVADLVWTIWNLVNNYFL